MMLTVKETARFLDMSEQTIYSLVKEGNIPFKRIRGRIYFHPDLLDAWLRETEGSDIVPT